MVSGINLHDLSAAVAEHGPLVRVVIADFKGSTPRETGTSMLVWPQGQSGTIGGGELEWRATTEARRITSGIRDITYPLGPALGQCCGGSVRLVLEHWDDTKLAAALENDVNTHDAVVAPFLARSLRGDQVTTKLAALPLSMRRTAQLMREGRGPTLSCAEGWLVETTTAAAIPVFLYGAGHVGRAIAQTLNGLPFDVTLIDDAPERFPDPLPAGATPFLARNPADAVPAAPGDAVHLVLTYSHALDLEICHRVLSRDFRHLGLIGSATKATRFRRRLAEIGHPPDRIARLACPIGERSLGKEPQAIAIGVAAELIRLSHVEEQATKETA